MDADAIREHFAAFGAVRIRRMFGGAGIYADDVMIALEAGGEISLKTDVLSQPAFREAGSRPFVYEKDGRRTTMSYWLAPASAVDDPEAMVPWARLALEAARRGKLAKSAGRRRPQATSGIEPPSF